MTNSMKFLTFSQCRDLLRAIDQHGGTHAKVTDRALVVSVLLCGNAARTWTWEDALQDILWMPYAVYQSIKAIAFHKQLSLFPFNHAGFTSAHWVRGVRLQRAIFSIGVHPLTTQEVTRRLKRYATFAGVPVETVSLRTLDNTHHLLMNTYRDADVIAEELGIAYEVPSSRSTSFFATASSPKREPRLHGIGRRTAVLTPR